MLPLALLAGGLATRLRPLTEHIPKSLVEVAGRPFIAHQLEYLGTQGIDDVVVCIGHLGAMIQAVVGDGHQFGVRVRYSSDGPVPLGTGGALRQALPLLGDAFFVMYGDSYLPICLAEVETAFLGAAQPALMTVYKNDGKFDVSNVIFVDGVIQCYDKKNRQSSMNYIDYGLSVLSRKILQNYREGTVFDISDVFSVLSLQQQLAAFETFSRFYEIGSYQGLQEMQVLMTSGASK